MSSIKSIGHKGFGAPNVTFEARGVTVFDGPLGCGKSTALLAVPLAMTGEVPGGPKQLREITRQLAVSRDAGLSASIGIEHPEGVSVISRILGEKEIVQLVPKPPGKASKAALNQAIAMQFHGPPLPADLGEFSESPEKVKAKLLDMLGGSQEIDLPRIISDTIPKICDEGTWEAVTKHGNALLKDHPQQGQPMGDWVAVLESEARELQNAATKFRQDTETALRASRRSGFDVDRLAQSIADKQARLDELRRRLGDEQRDLGEQQERHKRRETAEKRLADAKRMMGEITFPPGWNSETAVKDLANIEAAAKKIESIQREVTEAEQAVDTARRKNDDADREVQRQRERHKMRIEGLSTKALDTDSEVAWLREIARTVKCPECGHEYILETYKQAIADAQTAHKAAEAALLDATDNPSLDIATAEEAMVQAVNTHRQAQTKYDAKATLLKTARSNAVRLVRELQKSDPDMPRETPGESTLLACIEHIKGRLAQNEQRTALVEHVQTFARELSEMGATVSLDEQATVVEGIQSEIAEAEEAIRIDQAELGVAQKYLRQQQELEALRETETALKGLRKVLQQVRTDIVRDAFRPLTTNINSLVGKVLPGEISLNDRGEFVYVDGDRWRTWSALSTGERTLIGLAIAGSIVSLRPPEALRCVTLDNAECVGQERMFDVVRLAIEIWKLLKVQVILAAHFDQGQLSESWIEESPDILVHDLARDEALAGVA